MNTGYRIIDPMDRFMKQNLFKYRQFITRKHYSLLLQRSSVLLEYSFLFIGYLRILIHLSCASCTLKSGTFKHFQSIVSQS